METDHNSIHRWLARVPDVRSACNATGNPNQLGIPLADTLRIASKITETTREHGDVEDASLVQGQIPNAGSGVHPSFDRKPRHKTREDRYEYKGAGTGKEQSASHKDKSKRRRSRKHTINDEFRAPNVARERLTLRSNPSVGIFNKGKASSPLKLGHVPDSAFSEQRFLTKRHPGSPLKSPATDKKRKMSYKAPKKGASRTQKRPEYIFSELAKEFEIAGDSIDQLISQAGELDQPNDDEPKIDQGRCVGTSSGLVVQREQPDARSLRSILIHPVEKSASWSQSATPYTWSKTSHGKLQPGHTLESELLKLLRVGLLPAQGDNSSRNPNQIDTYYNLDDLKDMLDSRKIFWPPETSQTRQIVATTPLTGLHPDLLPEIHKTCKGVRSGDLTDSKHSQANHLDTKESSTEMIIPRQSFCRPVSQPHGQKEVNSISQPERVEQVNFNIDCIQEAQESPPDDIFFNTLDAAFWEIVDPKTQNEMDSLVMIGIQQSSSTFDFEDIMTTAELNSTNITKGPSHGLLSHAQVGVETLYPLPPVAHDHFDPKSPVTILEKDQGKIILPKTPQKQFSNHMTIQRQPYLQSSAIHDSNDDPIPPGFWRQNRLY
ncbi:hypothetical protein N7486_000392 [Penicillium sp. IBT 16267x]|nr:hypothetical protein N7486_000392 [Penicillium sp. IBT 16267x]